MNIVQLNEFSLKIVKLLYNHEPLQSVSILESFSTFNGDINKLTFDLSNKVESVARGTIRLVNSEKNVPITLYLDKKSDVLLVSIVENDEQLTLHDDVIKRIASEIINN